jgi:hypothetical protein
MLDRVRQMVAPDSLRTELGEIELKLGALNEQREQHRLTAGNLCAVQTHSFFQTTTGKSAAITRQWEN